MIYYHPRLTIYLWLTMDLKRLEGLKLAKEIVPNERAMLCFVFGYSFSTKLKVIKALYDDEDLCEKIREIFQRARLEIWKDRLHDKG